MLKYALQFLDVFLTVKIWLSMMLTELAWMISAWMYNNTSMYCDDNTIFVDGITLRSNPWVLYCYCHCGLVDDFFARVRMLKPHITSVDIEDVTNCKTYNFTEEGYTCTSDDKPELVEYMWNAMPKLGKSD